MSSSLKTNAVYKEGQVHEVAKLKLSMQFLVNLQLGFQHLETVIETLNFFLISVILCADTIPPTAYITASKLFTNALNVSVNISFTEPCTGGGFGCSSVNACNVSSFNENMLNSFFFFHVRTQCYRYILAIVIYNCETL